ncbi:MAG: alpha/beta hydrolase [Acidobacteriota bacterium]
MKFLQRIHFQLTLVVLAVTVFLTSMTSYGAPMGPVQFVEVDGIRTGYVEGGRGEVMVLVHGGHFGSTVESMNRWRFIFDHLASHFHVYALDKLGQGFTDNPQSDPDYSMDAVTQHIVRFMEVLDIQTVHLVGHSRGALPAARIAADYPEMITTLTLFDSNTLAPDLPAVARPAAARTQPAAAPPTPTRESIRQGFVSDPRNYHEDFLTEEYLETELRLALDPKFKEVESHFSFLASEWVRLNPEKGKENPGLQRRWWYDEMKAETFRRINSGRLKSPTLIIWGYNDPSASYTLGVTLYEIFSKVVDQTRMHFFNQAGHYVFQDYPEEVADLMVGFIESVKEQ